MTESMVQMRARDLFTVLGEYGVMPDPAARKRLAIALAERGVNVAELRSKGRRLSRVDEWVRILGPRSGRDPAVNVLSMEDQRRARVDLIGYVRERILVDGKSAEFVARQCGLTDEEVGRILEEEADD